MSPEQLAKLRELTEKFEQGVAGPEQVKQLSEILSSHNRHVDMADKLSNVTPRDFKSR